MQVRRDHLMTRSSNLSPTSPPQRRVPANAAWGWRSRRLGMARRRGFGEVERRVSRSGEVTYRARYAMPDGSRFSRTLASKMDAEAWLSAERALIDRDSWSPLRA